MNYWISILIAASIIGGSEAFCPPADKILPCLCNEGSSLNFICFEEPNSTNAWDVKATFDYISSVVPEDVLFDYVMIVQSNLKEIPAGTIQSLKFKEVYIEDNAQLEYIHPDAFNGTLDSVTLSYIRGNDKLSNEGPDHSPQDVFEVARKFKNIKILEINNEAITSIPENALGNLSNLVSLRLSGNLSSVGSRAFSQLPSIEVISLRYSSELPVTEIFAPDSFEGIKNDVQLNMGYNPFTRLPEEVFKPILDSVGTLIVGGTICQGFNCRTIRMDCDEVSEWICEEQSYVGKLFGFACREESGFQSIFEYCNRTTSSQ